MIGDNGSSRRAKDNRDEMVTMPQLQSDGADAGCHFVAPNIPGARNARMHRELHPHLGGLHIIDNPGFGCRLGASAESN